MKIFVYQTSVCNNTRHSLLINSHVILNDTFTNTSFRRAQGGVAVSKYHNFRTSYIVFHYVLQIFSFMIHLFHNLLISNYYVNHCATVNDIIDDV